MPARIRQLLARHGLLVSIAVVYLYAFPYFPRIQSANELPRTYLVKAIVHDGTFAIDNGVRQWGATADVSPHGTHQYSNKAPGSSLVVVPVYAVVNAIAGEPSLGATMWICRVVSGVIPMLLFLALLARFIARFAPDPNVRRFVLVAYALGSMAMTYSILYFSHQLAAICIASAWIFAIDVAEQRGTARTMFAVGLLAGCAPLVDYQAAFAGVPIAVYLVYTLIKTRPLPALGRLLAIAVVGAAIPVTLLLWYHARCFGSPLRTGYDASTTWAVYHQQGFLGITKLRGEAFWGSLLSADNGLLALSPWLVLAIPGAVLLWRRRTTGDRPIVAVGTANAVIFIAFVSSITFWRGGWGVGPRYITAMLPFVLPFVAIAFTWLHERRALFGAASGLVLSAVAIYTLTSATFPYWPDSMKDPLYEVTFRLLGDGAVAPNLLRSTLGVLSLVPYIALCAVLVGVPLRRAAGWRAVGIAAAVAALILGLFALVPRTPGDRADRGYKNTVLPAVTK